MFKKYSRRKIIKISAKLCVGMPATYLVGCSNTNEAKTFNNTQKILLNTDSENNQTISNKSIALGSLRDGSSGYDVVDHIRQSLVYSRLIAIDPRTNYMYGDIIDELEVISSTEIKFRIKNDAYFHPNIDFLAKPVTSNDVAKSFLEYIESGDYFFTQVIDSIDIHDEKVFTINLNAPFAFFFDNLANISSNIYSQESYPDSDLKLGSGLFKFTMQDATSSLLTANNLTHRNNHPHVEKITIHQYSNDREFDAAFRSQNIDIREHPDTNSYESIPPNESVVQKIRPSQRMIGLGFSLLPIKKNQSTRYVEAFQDKRVRLAISNALDRNVLAQLAGGISASPIGLAHKSDSLSIAELESFKIQHYDLIESKKLLDASGYQSLSFEMLLKENQTLLSLANLIQEQLSVVNITTNLVVQNENSWKESFKSGDFETILFYSEPLKSPEMALRLHLSDSLGGSGSRWGFSDPIFDASVKKIYSQMFLHDRSEKILNAQKILLQQIPAMLPLVTPFDHASLNKDINGYEFDSYSFNFDWLAGHWSRM
tara:strand:- start:692 stop:2314 length:1623 start_codon:yes stop_codon:yes gene_type:complete